MILPGMRPSFSSQFFLGYKDIWMLEAVLDERDRDKTIARQAAAG